MSEADATKSNNIQAPQSDGNSVQVPAPLFKNYIFLMVAGAALIIVFAALFFLNSREYSAMYLSGVLVGLYILFKGFSIRHRWRKGLIEECIYRCVSCKKSYPFSVTTITRHKESASYTLVCTEVEESEEPHLYEFVINRGGEMVSPGQLVVLYVDKNSPKRPVAWKIF